VVMFEFDLNSGFPWLSANPLRLFDHINRARTIPCHNLRKSQDHLKFTDRRQGPKVGKNMFLPVIFVNYISRSHVTTISVIFPLHFSRTCFSNLFELEELFIVFLVKSRIQKPSIHTKRKMYIEL